METINLTKLEKAVKILEQIKVLDKEISEIDRYAMMIANGEVTAKCELKFAKPNEKPNEKPKENDTNINNILAERYGNNYTPFSLFRDIMRFANDLPTETKKEETLLLKYDLTDKLTLSVLAVFLSDKQTERQKLINKIKSLGINI